MEVKAETGWRLTATEARFATRLDPSRTDAHQIGVELRDLHPFPAGWNAAEPPAAISLLRIDATALLSAPIDRRAGETQPRLTGLELRDLTVTSGEVDLAAKGGLAAREGLAEGRIDLRLRGWREVPGELVRLGLVEPDFAPTIERMLSVLAAQSGGETVEVPLIFEDGWARLGPLPLGPAPRL
jgi:hypothetical protein